MLRILRLSRQEVCCFCGREKEAVSVEWQAHGLPAGWYCRTDLWKFLRMKSDPASDSKAEKEPSR